MLLAEMTPAQIRDEQLRSARERLRLAEVRAATAKERLHEVKQSRVLKLRQPNGACVEQQDKRSHAYAHHRA